MEENERLARGLEILEKINNKASSRAGEALALSPDLARYVVEYPFGDVWSRPGLDLKNRELATVSALIALGHFEPELEGHMSGMLRVGWTRDELIELIIHMSVYTGFPRALAALRLAGAVFAELDAEADD